MDSCRLCHHSFLAQFLRSRRAICSTDRTYKLPGSHVWAVLSSEKSRSPATAIKVSKSRHNSRTNLRTKVLSMQIRANIEISLYCLFQCLVFSERREMLVTDRRTDSTTTVCLSSSALGIMTDRHHDYSMPRGSAPRHNDKQTNKRTTVCRGSAPRHNNCKIIAFYLQSLHRNRFI